MIKEKIKTLIIVLLLISTFALTYEAWFKSGVLGPDFVLISFSDLPFARLFNKSSAVSVPKENLSKPRRIVVNDGELWVPYYNTDEAFENLDQNTAYILKSLLSGKIKTEKSISYESWIERLSDISVYVEYPIAVTPLMLSRVLNTQYKKIDNDISIVKDAIIIPAGEGQAYVALRDANTNKSWEFLVEDENIAFPREVAVMYTDRFPGDGYYEFAYSTLLGESLEGGNVEVDDMVLFSDNESVCRDIKVTNPLYGVGYENILKSFSFNAKPLRHYSDENGAVSYVENYATVTIFPEGYIEYSAVDENKGISLAESDDNEYEVLNSAIDFAEKVWSNVSNESLNVLVSGIDDDGERLRFTFDYYCGGREIAISAEPSGREGLYHGIEMVVVNGKIVSYRQYLRSYEEASSLTTQENFMTALDYFVKELKSGDGGVITDLYPGYFDGGETEGVLKTTWLCEISGQDKKLSKSR